MKNNFFKINDVVFVAMSPNNVRQGIIRSVEKRGYELQLIGESEIALYAPSQIFIDYRLARISSFNEGTKVYFYPIDSMGAMETATAKMCFRRRKKKGKVRTESMEVVIEGDKSIDARCVYVSEFEAKQAICLLNKSTKSGTIHYETVDFSKDRGVQAHAAVFMSSQGVFSRMYLN